MVTCRQGIRNLPVEFRHARPGAIPLGGGVVFDEITELQHEANVVMFAVLCNPAGNLGEDRSIRDIVRVMLGVRNHYHRPRRPTWLIGNRHARIGSRDAKIIARRQGVTRKRVRRNFKAPTRAYRADPTIERDTGRTRNLPLQVGAAPACGECVWRCPEPQNLWQCPSRDHETPFSCPLGIAR